MLGEIKWTNKIEAMKAYCLVCQHRSFTKAAVELNLSATMISRYIKQLEDSLGCLLIKRTTRSFAITEAGKEYYKSITPLLTQLANGLTAINDGMEKYQQQPHGSLRVSSSIEFGGQYLAPLIARFKRQFPAVNLSFNLTNEPVDLINDEADLVLRVAPQLANASLIAIPVCYSRLSLWASPDYLSAGTVPNNLEELAEHQLLFFEHSLRRHQWIFNQGGEQVEKKYQWAWSTNNGRLLNEAASQGQGIIQAPSYSVAKYVAEGTMEEVMPEYAVQPLTISAVYQHSAEYSKSIKSFVELAKAYFSENPLS